MPRPLPFWLAGLLASAACTGPAAPAPGSPEAAPPGPGPPGMAWAPVDSLDARLPPSVRVFAGVSERDTLRAWAVRLAPGVPLAVEVAADTSDGREAPTAFAERTGACVVLNGGYFNMDTGAPVGLVVDDGRLVSPASDTVERDGLTYPVARGAVGVGRGGSQPDRSQPGRVEIAPARDDGAAACRTAAPPNRPGAPAETPACAPWAVAEALGAGPVLALDGRPALGTDAEVFFGTSIPDRHPRSAVGTEAGGAVWLVVVDGRQPASRGVTLDELATLVLGLGARDVLNLDGGGSSALVVRPPGGAPVRLNLPTGYDVEREVSTALAARCR